MLSKKVSIISKLSEKGFFHAQMTLDCNAFVHFETHEDFATENYIADVVILLNLFLSVTCDRKRFFFTSKNLQQGFLFFHMGFLRKSNLKTLLSSHYVQRISPIKQLLHFQCLVHLLLALMSVLGCFSVEEIIF